LTPLKRLASQTAIYGVSSVLGRFLNYLLVPLYTYSFLPAAYSVVVEFYAYMGFLAVILAFGLETGYFRFREEPGLSASLVFATVLRFLLLANTAFLLLKVAADESPLRPHPAFFRSTPRHLRAAQKGQGLPAAPLP